MGFLGSQAAACTFTQPACLNTTSSTAASPKVFPCDTEQLLVLVKVSGQVHTPCEVGCNLLHKAKGAISTALVWPLKGREVQLLHPGVSLQECSSLRQHATQQEQTPSAMCQPSAVQTPVSLCTPEPLRMRHAQHPACSQLLLMLQETARSCSSH